MKIITEKTWGTYDVTLDLGRRLKLVSEAEYTTKGNARRAVQSLLQNLEGDGYLAPDYDDMRICVKNRKGRTLVATSTSYSTKGNLERALATIQSKIDTKNVEFIDK